MIASSVVLVVAAVVNANVLFRATAAKTSGVLLGG